MNLTVIVSAIWILIDKRKLCRLVTVNVIYHFQSRWGLDLGHDDGGPGHGLRSQLQQGRASLCQGLQAAGQETFDRRGWTIRTEIGKQAFNYGYKLAATVDVTSCDRFGPDHNWLLNRMISITEYISYYTKYAIERYLGLVQLNKWSH